MLRLTRLLFFVILFVYAATYLFAVRRERLIDGWRPINYSISLTLDDKLQNISAAKAEVDIQVLKSLSSIDFDFGEMDVDSVALNSTALRFDHKNGKLLVQLPSAVKA